MGFARAIGFTSSIAAKLWAIRDGLTRCCNVSLEAVEVEIDASATVSLVSQATHTNGELSSLIDDCRNLMKNIPQVRLKHCFREANRCTNALAKFGAYMEDDFIVFESLPSLIVSFLYSDHCFQNRTGPGGRTVKTGNRDENQFFKPKEPDFLLIP